MNRNQKIYIPIWHTHQLLQKPETLLALPVYEKIANLINSNIERKKAPLGITLLDNSRAHETILISGDRGTGKSAVLENLHTYLKQPKATFHSLNDKLLILRPVDPTLLDSDHDLLLNIIVAAIIRDPLVLAKLENKDQQTQDFYASLHRLGAALEAVQTRSEKYGLERLRSFIGNHGLADEIHKFFHQTLTLMEKDLIILPIDDVDTSLNHAFENLEIVRKYLSSSLVLPIISGDIKLYHEVIWREMHGRMLKESRAEELEAVPRAKALAQEYEVKVLPLSRRLSMPKIDDYLKNNQVVLVNNRNQKDNKELMPLPNYVAWIEALLNERVNGVENSRLRLPIRSLRLLTQLISATRNGIADISDSLPQDALSIRRSIFMPMRILPEIEAFSSKLQLANTFVGGTRTRHKNLAYKSLYNLAENARRQDHTQLHKSWAENLLEHFKSQFDAGGAYLILSAWLTWMDSYSSSNTSFSNIDSTENNRILNCPLFMPTMHKFYEEFDQQYELAASWRKQIPEKYAPESWFAKLPAKAILPYPLPELGRQMSALGNLETSKESDFSESAELLRLIMVHRNFYSRSEKTAMVYCGRLFEIVVSSFAGDLSEKEIVAILGEHPFYSLTMLANTKTLDLSSEEEDGASVPQDQYGRDRKQPSLPAKAISELQRQIKTWRRKNKISTPHPWIFYNVMNKFYNQVSIFNARETRNNSQGSIEEMALTASKAFNALWATFGSFEKGPLFGFDTTIAYQNVGTGEFSRSPLYHTNVAPLTELPPIMGSFTQALATHPIRQLITHVRSEIHAKNSMGKGLDKRRP